MIAVWIDTNVLREDFTCTTNISKANTGEERGWLRDIFYMAGGKVCGTTRQLVFVVSNPKNRCSNPLSSNCCDSRLIDCWLHYMIRTFSSSTFTFLNSVLAACRGKFKRVFSFFLPSSTLECHGPAVNDIHRKYYVKKKRQSWDSKPSQSQIQKNIAPNSFTIFSVLFDRHKKRINHSMAHTGYLFYDIDSHPDVGNFAGWAPNRNWVTMRVRLSQHRINKTPRTASRARDILYLWMTHSIESLLFVIFLRWCQYKWRANESCV